MSASDPKRTSQLRLKVVLTSERLERQKSKATCVGDIGGSGSAAPCGPKGGGPMSATGHKSFARRLSTSLGSLTAASWVKLASK
jgi:hypothetical protein